MKTRVDAEALRKEVESVAWWHTIDLGHGIVTPGHGGSHVTLERLRLPSDLSGKSVLDIGTFDGHFAFEAEKRGAERVVAIDLFQHDGFPIAHRALRSTVEYYDRSVMDLTPDDFGMFDIVIYSGVIYHLPNPVESLLRVHAVTREVAIIETDSALNHVPVPAAEFRGERAGLVSDAPNWWIFNEKCLLEMIHVAGFARAETVWGPGPRRPGRLKRMLQGGLPRIFAPPKHARLVVHAWK
jgi:tRNA (mo5U34)-methyltransferase